MGIIGVILWLTGVINLVFAKLQDKDPPRPTCYFLNK